MGYRKITDVWLKRRLSHLVSRDFDSLAQSDDVPETI